MPICILPKRVLSVICVSDTRRIVHFRVHRFVGIRAHIYIIVLLYLFWSRFVFIRFPFRGMRFVCVCLCLCNWWIEW